jgi:hypothetical protein
MGLVAGAPGLVVMFVGKVFPLPVALDEADDFFGFGKTTCRLL